MTFQLDTIEPTGDSETVQKLLALLEEALDKYLTPYLFEVVCDIIPDEMVEVHPVMAVEFVRLRTPGGQPIPIPVDSGNGNETGSK